MGGRRWPAFMSKLCPVCVRVCVCEWVVTSAFLKCVINVPLWLWRPRGERGASGVNINSPFFCVRLSLSLSAHVHMRAVLICIFFLINSKIDLFCTSTVCVVTCEYLLKTRIVEFVYFYMFVDFPVQFNSVVLIQILTLWRSWCSVLKLLHI